MAGIYPNTVCDILPMKVLGLVVAGSWEAPVTSESVSGQCLGLRRSRFHLAVAAPNVYAPLKPITVALQSKFRWNLLSFAGTSAGL